jgi:hypothetical protein
MSETKAKEVKTTYDPDELVDYVAPLLPGTSQADVFCAVNGETCVIKRGIPVKIKRKFYDVLMNANAQQLAAYQAKSDMKKKSSKATAEM